MIRTIFQRTLRKIVAHPPRANYNLASSPSRLVARPLAGTCPSINHMNPPHIAISLKRFLLIEQCPAEWKPFDLYLFRDETVAFYVGQSHLAFGRVWEHLHNGFKGHSIVGRFVWVNWPKSMNFTIELLSSQTEPFAAVGYDLNASERVLIQQWSPCFNVSQNSQPTPVPAGYLPPNAPFRRRRSLKMLMHEAERAVQAEDTKRWLQQMDE